ncbi:c-type cytochrome [Octadecabacter sp. 1_MG-2023]|uniref:c-type cytochrome n=1 Tax=unclassified Octadecabacter TaxID=196158 RepID=UPI001C0A2E1E|nr:MULTISPECIES: c-type cytochrome [unclassified Octadecabacter]MBU2993889.1 c-type cytochrome [Octadecabacter sp. B2R22]MDO6735265.1 c-type cytochrome [Octadecabacter sp. 1_MG-2023]
MKHTLWIAPLLLAGCVEQELDVSVEAGELLFQNNCAACHGGDAKGMGEFGEQLFNMPSDLTVLAADNGGVFPRDYVLGVIDGFHRADEFSAAMPEFGAEGMGPTVLVEDENGEVTPIPARLLALGTYLESIQE